MTGGFAKVDTDRHIRGMGEPAIVAEGLRKCFGKVIAVEEATFAAAAGSATALLGGNGAGKTTTIAMLLGLILPTSGTARVLGHDMSDDRQRALPALNFTSPYIDLPHRLTVRQNLEIYARLYGLSDVAARCTELARQLDMTGFLDRPVGQLSAGQKTRAALAKALINDPDVLFLDEPTASLDPDTADWVRTWLEDYRRRTGATLFLASHNMAEVERLCDQVLIMRQGRIVERGAPGDLIARYGRENLEEVFLDIARGRGRAAALLGNG